MRGCGRLHVKYKTHNKSIKFASKRRWLGLRKKRSATYFGRYAVMKLSNKQLDVDSLGALDLEACNLILQNNYHNLADRFGYAVSFNRAPIDAITSDINRCLNEEGRKAKLSQVIDPNITVKYFDPNDSGLFACVECFLKLEQDNGGMGVDLIVVNNEGQKHVTLEDISYTA